MHTTQQNHIHHTIRLTQSPSRTSLQRLSGVEGLLGAARHGAYRLELVYDLSRLCWSEVVPHLEQVGIRRKQGLWQRWRDGLRDLQDQNLRDNLKHTPACCSRPPVGAGRHP